MSERIIRVFPRKTRATPDDRLVYINRGPDLLAEADQVHVSVAFTWDLPRAERLARQWKCVAPVSIGGPAIGQRSEEFVPGRYVREGDTITSRGCPNKCWFCSVWKREGGIRELPIQAGSNVLDDNLLACSDNHIKSVFRMLRDQLEKVQFTGGLEAARLEDWHVEEFGNLGLSGVFFAYDTEDDLEPLRRAGRMLAGAGLISTGSMEYRCYVLVGFPKDTFGRADGRMYDTMSAGFVPYVMIHRDGKMGNIRSEAWKDFKRRWRGNSSVIRSICAERRIGLLNNVKGDK